MRSNWLALLLSLVAAVTLVLARETRPDIYERDVDNSLRLSHRGNVTVNDRILPRRPKPFYDPDNSGLNGTSSHNDPPSVIRRSPTSTKKPNSPKPDSSDFNSSEPTKTPDFEEWERLARGTLSPGERYAILEVNGLHHSLIIGKVDMKEINLNGKKQFDIVDVNRYDVTGSLKTMKCEAKVRNWDINQALSDRVTLTWKGKVKENADPVAAGEKLLNGPKGDTFNPGADRKFLDKLPGNNCRTFVDAVWADIKA